MAKAAIAFKNEVKAKAAALPPAKGSYVCDEGGLYVQLAPLPAGLTDKEAADRYGALLRPASFVFRYRSRTTGKLREMGLGPYWDVDLKEARDRAAEARAQLRAGVDPIEHKKLGRQEAAVALSKAVTFDQAAEQYIAAQRAGWKNAKHVEQWQNTLKEYAGPAFGQLPIAAVDVGLVLRALEPIWQTKPETAGRVRGRIESILDWATTREYRAGPNPARWKGHLEHMLASRRKMAGAGNQAASVEHHPALPYNEIGDFVSRVQQQKGLAAMALEFTILTASRTSEVIGARWCEFDLQAAEWLIPGERMKAKKPHRVPLPARAIELLRELLPLAKDEPLAFVFPGLRAGEPLSNMAMLTLLRRMDRADLTVHGFRSTFRDWAAECTAYPGDVVEMALAHSVRDKTEAAYRRGDLFEKRRRLMEDWATRCLTRGSSSGAVLPLNAARA